MDCDREGDFRGEIIEYGLTESKEGAVGVQIKAQLNEIYDPNIGEWIGWSEYQQEAWGTLWIVKKDGNPNENAVRSLVCACGWDGTLGSIANQEFRPNPCQFNVKADTYQNQTRFKVSFVNEYDRKPGGLGTVSPEKLKELTTRFGAPLRALAGSAKMQAKPTESKPKAPPRQPANVGAGNGTSPKDDIPF